MAKRWRSLGKAFWALDRVLGGQQRPTRLHQWVARHPVGTGLCTAVPFTLFFWLTAPEGEPDSLLFTVIFGLLMGLVFGLTAVLERLRQRRLKRLGIWDGS
ncbi:hypothetical protein JL475_23100 [Streptomyces sp. M2CJ-2]|nr:hypothetical protein [Streptomyces sp. M2CJ-2]